MREKTIRLITYNTLGFSRDCSSDTNDRKIALVEHIENSNVDIALLQEIKTIYPQGSNVGYNTEEFIRQSEIFKDNTRIIYGDQRHNSKEGVAILSKSTKYSKFKIIDEIYGPLPKGIFGRSFIICQIETPTKERFYVMTFHLAAPAIGRIITQYNASHEKQELARQRQLEKISELIKNLDQRYPIIIGGDFNTETKDEKYLKWRSESELIELWPEIRDEKRKTFATHPSPSFDCGLDMRLDHLLFKNGTEYQLNSIEDGCIFDKVIAINKYFYGYLSDHIGLYFDFTISPKNSDSTKNN
jgi:endonuclease/exonuclease/phosphatase family metal-dependent hydrolase